MLYGISALHTDRDFSRVSGCCESKIDNEVILDIINM